MLVSAGSWAAGLYRRLCDGVVLDGESGQRETPSRGDGALQTTPMDAKLEALARGLEMAKTYISTSVQPQFVGLQMVLHDEAMRAVVAGEYSFHAEEQAARLTQIRESLDGLEEMSIAVGIPRPPDANEDLPHKMGNDIRT